MNVYYICVHDGSGKSSGYIYLNAVRRSDNPITNNICVEWSMFNSDVMYFQCEIFAKVMVELLIRHHVLDKVNLLNKPLYHFAVVTKQMNDTSNIKNLFTYDDMVKWGLTE